MYNFDENKVRQEHQNGVDIIPKVESIVDQVCKEGYSNIFYIGIGGTVLYANQMMHISKQLGSTLPLYIENAADFNLVGNPFFNEKSVVVIESISGDTKEVVEAVDKAHKVGAKVIGYVEKFNLVGNPFFNEKSVVVIESISGDTKEVVEAVDKAHKVGAKVIGYVEKEGTPLYEKSDYLVSTVGGGYYFWYTVTLRFMKNAGLFEKYDQFMKDIVHMPDAVVEIYKEVDEDAKAYAEKYCDEPITYLIGSGNLEDWATCYGMCIMEEMQWMRTRPISAANFFHEKYCDEPITYLIGSGNLEDWATCYGMCIMEEMQWMRTRPISAANFFHGTLEVIERDIPVILIKGEDITRPEMERVEKFVNTISAKVSVFDTKKFKMEGIRQEFRGMLAPIAMRSAFQRVNVHLEYFRRHPLAIRRYYRRLDY